MPERRRLTIADEQREERREDDAPRRCAGMDVHGEELERPDRGIGADAEEGGVAEGEIAGQAEQDVEADGEDAEDAEFLHQGGIGRADRLEQDRQAER